MVIDRAGEAAVAEDPQVDDRVLVGQLPDQEGDEADRGDDAPAPTMIGEPNQSSSLPLSSMICSAPTKSDQQAEADEVDAARARSGSRCWRSMRQAKKPQTAATGTLM